MKRKLFGAFIIITLICSAISYGILQYTFSRGMRSGKLVKISKKGVFLKTYEGTLDLGSGDQLTWHFSIHDDKLGDQLVAQSGKNVSLEYRELIFKLFYETKYDVEAWKLDGVSVDYDYLCRLVNFIRKNSSVVNYLRPMIEREDRDLLSKIRDCQKTN